MDVLAKDLKDFCITSLPSLMHLKLHTVAPPRIETTWNNLLPPTNFISQEARLCTVCRPPTVRKHVNDAWTSDMSEMSNYIESKHIIHLVTSTTIWAISSATPLPADCTLDHSWSLYSSHLRTGTPHKEWTITVSQRFLLPQHMDELGRPCLVTLVTLVAAAAPASRCGGVIYIGNWYTLGIIWQSTL